MKKIVRTSGIFLLVFFSVFFGLHSWADVAIPSGTQRSNMNVDYNRNSIYRPRSIYMTDTGSKTMLLSAPATLATDSTQFVLPATNGSVNDVLRSNGTGTTSWVAAGTLTGLNAGTLTGTLPAINGGALTDLNAANLTGTLPAINGGSLTVLNAGSLTGTAAAINGAAITVINAGSITGTVAVANGGTAAGTATGARASLGVGISDAVTFDSVTAGGTTGSGYLDLVHQSVTPAGPGSGSLNTRLFTSSGNVWMVTDTGTVSQITPTLSNPMTGAGDMIRGGAAGAPTNLPAGTSGQILVSQGAAAPAWLNYYAATGAAGLVNNDSSNVSGTPIKGATNGVASVAGYVGEVLTASLLSVTGATTWTDSTNVLSLTAGAWLIYYNDQAYRADASGSDNGYGSARIALGTGTGGTTIVSSERFMYTGAGSDYTYQYAGTFSLMGTLNTSSGVSVYGQILSDQNSGTTTRIKSRGYGSFYGVRIR